jgi:hypothetical protein
MNCPAQNKDVCPCTEDCENHGKCCACIRSHIGNKTWPQTACMRLGKLKG